MRANQSASAARALKKKIVIEPESSSKLLNFGGSGGTRSFFVILSASEPLPGGFTGKQLELDSPERPTRVSSTFDTATLPMPRFSHPQIIEHRKKIRFRVCLDATDANAGVYTDEINISGPPRLSSASVVATANVKVKSAAFFVFVLGVLIVALLLLVFKATKEGRKEEEKWHKSLWRTCKNPNFLVSTAIALVSAFFAMHALYDQNPAWGADVWSNLPTLAGAAFAATGVGSVISAITPGAPSEETTNG